MSEGMASEDQLATKRKNIKQHTCGKKMQGEEEYRKRERKKEPILASL